MQIPSGEEDQVSRFGPVTAISLDHIQEPPSGYDRRLFKFAVQHSRGPVRGLETAKDRLAPSDIETKLEQDVGFADLGAPLPDSMGSGGDQVFDKPLTLLRCFGKQKLIEIGKNDGGCL